MKHISEFLPDLLPKRGTLGEKVIYLSILSFDKYPKRDVRTLTAAEKERYQAFECKMFNAPLVGRVG